MPSNSYTLICLGTSTIYMPQASVDYPRGETFSALAALLAGDASPALPDTDSVKLIEGPDPLGQQVGEKIADGVLSILKAIKAGKRDINIMGHSRGGIEALLIAWELEQILKDEKSPNLFSALTSTPCPYTRRAYEHIQKDAVQKQRIQELGDLKTLQSALKEIKVDVYTLDPVAGDDLIEAVPIIGWKDKRYFRIPNIVSVYNTVVLEHERSRCFTAVIPSMPLEVEYKPVASALSSMEEDDFEYMSVEPAMGNSRYGHSTDRNFELAVIPGHHGSASGNPYDQQKQRRINGAEHIQDIATVKILKFLKEMGALPAECPADLPLPLMSIMQRFYAEDTSDLLLDVYGKLFQHRPDYQQLTKGSYAFMGRERSPQSGAEPAMRVVRTEHTGKVELGSVLSLLENFAFINDEHAFLALMKEFDSSPTADTENLLAQRLHKLIHFLTVLPSNPPGSAIYKLLQKALPFMNEMSGDLSASQYRRKIHDPEIKIFLALVFRLINELTQVLLEENFAEKDQSELFQSLQLFMQKIEDASADSPEVQSVKEGFLSFATHALLRAIQEIVFSKVHFMLDKIKYHNALDLNDENNLSGCLTLLFELQKGEDYQKELDKLLEQNGFSLERYKTHIEEISEKFDEFFAEANSYGEKVGQHLSAWITTFLQEAGALQVADVQFGERYQTLSRKLTNVFSPANKAAIAQFFPDMNEKISACEAAVLLLSEHRSAYEMQQQLLEQFNQAKQEAEVLITWLPDSMGHNHDRVFARYAALKEEAKAAYLSLDKSTRAALHWKSSCFDLRQTFNLEISLSAYNKLENYLKEREKSSYQLRFFNHDTRTEPVRKLQQAFMLYANAPATYAEQLKTALRESMTKYSPRRDYKNSLQCLAIEYAMQLKNQNGFADVLEGIDLTRYEAVRDAQIPRQM